MAYRITWFLTFFFLLGTSGTFLLANGHFNAGVALGSVITAAVIAAIIKPKR